MMVPPPPPPSVWTTVVSRSRTGSVMSLSPLCFGGSTLRRWGGSSACPEARIGLGGGAAGPGPRADEGLHLTAGLDRHGSGHAVFDQPVAADIAIEMRLRAQRLHPGVERAAEAVDRAMGERRGHSPGGRRGSLLGRADVVVLARNSIVDGREFLVAPLRPRARRGGGGGIDVDRDQQPPFRRGE